MGYAYQRKIEIYTRCSKVMSSVAVKTLSEVISTQLGKLQEMCDRCKCMAKSAENQVTYFKNSHKLHLKTVDLLTHPDESISIDASTWIKKLSDACQVNYLTYVPYLLDSKPTLYLISAYFLDGLFKGYARI